MPLPKIVWKKSPNYTVSKIRKIKYIVIHWWDDPKKKPTLAGTVAWLCNPKTRVSAHYVVETGKVYRLVDEKDVAWHSSGENHESIGIECNPLQRVGDYQTIAELVADIWKRRGIMPIYPHKKLGNTACPGNYNIGKIHSMALQVLIPPKPTPQSPKSPQTIVKVAPSATTAVKTPVASDLEVVGTTSGEDNTVIPPIDTSSDTETAIVETKVVITLPKNLDLKLIWDKVDDFVLELGRLFLVGGGVSVVAVLLEKIAQLPVDPAIVTVLTFALRAVDRWLHEKAPAGEKGGVLPF